MSAERERLAGVLVMTRLSDYAGTDMAVINEAADEVLASDWLAEHDRKVKAAALRDAARDANERGDIGKPDGVEAWDYLNARANRIEAEHA